MSAATATDAPLRSAAETTVAARSLRTFTHPRAPHGPLARRSVRSSQDGVKESSRTEANGIVRREPGLLLDGLDRLPRGFVGLDVCGVERDAQDLRRAPRQADPLVQLDELDERRNRVSGASLDLGRAREMAEHERVGCAAVEEPEGDSGVHRVDDRALALDEEELAASLRALHDELLPRSGEEVGDHGV